MHLIYVCNIHYVARICRIECFRHAPSYLVTQTPFSQLSLYNCQMAHLLPQEAQAHDEQQPQQPAPPLITAVAIKLSLFWPVDPLVWFAQIEVQFDRHGQGLIMWSWPSPMSLPWRCAI